MLPILVMVTLVAVIAATSAFAQKTSNLSGSVKDAQTGDGLPGANVLLVGSGMGATSDVQGRFVVRNIPAGAYTLRVTYLGYEPISTSITVQAGTDMRKDFKLNAVAIEGETIVVTAQAAGQNEAINRQLTSMPVMNAVSAARIQELPDANAAESVGRLPGVSLVRTGGEGAQVVDPGTVAAVQPGHHRRRGDAERRALREQHRRRQRGCAGGSVEFLGDRAADLSMISSSMLGGIEVIKAITPDMDATLIGGVVNFGLRKAASAGQSRMARSSDASWVPRIDLRAPVGYNNLKDYVPTTSPRRWRNASSSETFGVFLQGSASSGTSAPTTGRELRPERQEPRRCRHPRSDLHQPDGRIQRTRNVSAERSCWITSTTRVRSA